MTDMLNNVYQYLFQFCLGHFFNCFVLIKSSDEGFIAAYLFSFIFTIYAFLKQSLLELYTNLLSSLSMFNEIFGLFLSNSDG